MTVSGQLDVKETGCKQKTENVSPCIAVIMRVLATLFLFTDIEQHYLQFGVVVLASRQI